MLSMIGIPEILVIAILLLIFSIVIYIYWAVADYGSKTSLGFGCSLLLAIFTSPIIAYFILLLFFPQQSEEGSRSN